MSWADETRESGGIEAGNFGRRMLLGCGTTGFSKELDESEKGR
jgi:hypothetical protein